MQNHKALLLGCPLFAGIAAGELETMLACLSVHEHAYRKGSDIFHAGAEAFQIGVVLTGSVDIVQEDFWGNQGILSRLEPGDIFAESFVLAQAEALPVSVCAAQDCEVLLLDYGRILHACTNACAFHERLIANLLAVVARKNIALTQKIEHVTKRTTREKLLSFLSAQARKAGSSTFSIPYDRQALANYLAVDRSAMSSELSRMRKEGLLAFHKEHFELTQRDM